MKSALTVLPPASYAAFLEHVSTAGVERSHKARIRDSDGTVATVYAKCYPPIGVNKGLVNEVVGYLTASALGLPQPLRAHILFAPVSVLAQIYPDIGWAQSGLNFYPLWCTHEVPGKTPNQVFTMPPYDDPVFMKDIESWPHLSETAAFDEWLANVDRNTGNLVRSGKGKYVLIDHGRVVTGPVWTVADLVPAKYFANLIVQFWWKGAPTLPNKNKMAKAAEKFQAEYILMSAELEQWLDKMLPPVEKLALLSFVSWRAGACETMIKDRYGLVA